MPFKPLESILRLPGSVSGAGQSSATLTLAAILAGASGVAGLTPALPLAGVHAFAGMLLRRHRSASTAAAVQDHGAAGQSSCGGRDELRELTTRHFSHDFLLSQK